MAMKAPGGLSFFPDVHYVLMKPLPGHAPPDSLPEL